MYSALFTSFYIAARPRQVAQNIHFRSCHDHTLCCATTNLETTKRRLSYKKTGSGSLRSVCRNVGHTERPMSDKLLVFHEFPKHPRV